MKIQVEKEPTGSETEKLYTIARRNMNAPFRRMIADVRFAIDTKNLYFNDFQIILPHGRGACATSGIIFTILYGIEKDFEYKQIEQIHLADPEWIKKREKTFKPYHTAPTQDRNIIGHTVMLCNTIEEVKSLMYYVAWGIKRLGLMDKYDDSIAKNRFVRKDYNAKIYCMTLDQFRKFKGQFKYVYFYNVDRMRYFQDFISLKDKALEPLNDEINTFCFAEYNVPESSSHWTYNTFTRLKSKCRTLKVYFGTYQTVPQDWLGEGFFTMANLLKKENPRAYENEYLGKATTIF